MRILAVDDDRIALELLEISLRSAGYNKVDFCLSAKEALSLINDDGEAYDCMLLDIMMPEMNGVELCRKVRSMTAYQNIPIIMITAVNDQKMLEDAISVGATDYVNKPFDGLELGARLRTASLLRNATKHSSKAWQPDDPEHKRSEGPLLKLEDTFRLEQKPNLVGQTELWYELIEKEQLPQTTHLFAMAVVDAPGIFETLPHNAYREFINELASVMAKTLHQWRPRITYYGDGILLFSLLNGPANPLKEIPNHISSSIAKTPLISLGRYSKPVVLWFEQVEPNKQKEQRSIDALRALLRAGSEAKSSALAHHFSARQNTIRSEILGRKKPKNIGSWKMSLTGPRERIKPRRVKRVTCTRAEKVNFFYSDQVSKDKDNLFSDI